jgi:hypothetical protein
MRIFGAKRQEIAGGLRKLLNEELQNFHSSSNMRKTRSDPQDM